MNRVAAPSGMGSALLDPRTGRMYADDGRELSTCGCLGTRFVCSYCGLHRDRCHEAQKWTNRVHVHAYRATPCPGCAAERETSAVLASNDPAVVAAHILGGVAPAAAVLRDQKHCIGLIARNIDLAAAYLTIPDWWLRVVEHCGRELCGREWYLTEAIVHWIGADPDTREPQFFEIENVWRSPIDHVAQNSRLMAIERLIGWRSGGGPT